MFLIILVFSVLFAIVYGLFAFIVGAIIGKRYHDDWIVSKAVKIFDGAFNVGVGAYILNDTGRHQLAKWIVKLSDLDYYAADDLYETLYEAFVFVGALDIALGVGVICWGLFEGFVGRPKPVVPLSPVVKAFVEKTADKEASPSNSNLFCPRCGARISEHCVICPGCGQLIAQKKTSAEPEKKEAPAPEKEETSQTQVKIDSERIARLKELRAQGLITEEEYLQALSKKQ